MIKLPRNLKMIKVGEALGSYMRSLRLSSIAVEEDEGVDSSGRHDVEESEDEQEEEERV